MSNSIQKEGFAITHDLVVVVVVKVETRKTGNNIIFNKDATLSFVDNKSTAAS